MTDIETLVFRETVLTMEARLPTAPEVRNTDDIKLAFETLVFLDGIPPERARLDMRLTHSRACFARLRPRTCAAKFESRRAVPLPVDERVRLRCRFALSVCARSRAQPYVTCLPAVPLQ